MLRYEQIIKEDLQDNGVKFLGMQSDGKILVEAEGNQHIYRVEKIDNTIRIYNVYNDLMYTLELI